MSVPQRQKELEIQRLCQQYDIDSKVTEKFINLCLMPKWQRKKLSTLETTLKRLKFYRSDFAIQLIEEAMCNNWQGVIFKDTPKRYGKFLSEKTSKIENVLGWLNDSQIKTI